jgi:hypothetical protein
MMNPLNHYSNSIGLHCLASEIPSLVKNDLIVVQQINLKTKTENLFPDFLYLMWLTKIKSKKKQFFLSDAEKKFQTKIIVASILNLKLSQKQFNIFFSYLFKRVFRDFLKQSRPKILALFNEQFLIHIKQVPFLMYNPGSLFIVLFQHMTYLNIQLLIHFKPNSMPKKLFFMFFYKFLVLEHIN